MQIFFFLILKQSNSPIPDAYKSRNCSRYVTGWVTKMRSLQLLKFAVWTQTKCNQNEGKHQWAQQNTMSVVDFIQYGPMTTYDIRHFSQLFFRYFLMVWCLLGTKPLPEPTLIYWQLDLYKQTSMKWKYFENVICNMASILFWPLWFF